MLHKRFFCQIEKQEEMTYIYLGLFYPGHLYVAVLCITFLGKSFAVP